MKSGGKKAFYIVFGAAVIVLALALGSYRVFNNETVRQFTAMDTLIGVSITGRESAKAAADIETLINTLDKDVYSRHSPSSAVSAINRDGSGKLPEECAGVLELMRSVAAKSGGAFDFTLGGVSDLWGFGTDKEHIPVKSVIDEALESSGYEKVKIDGLAVTIPDGMVLDMGAVGKGAALDEIRGELGKYSVRRAVISLGGSILLYGNGEFRVGIQTPGSAGGEYFALLTLPETNVSTSGSYERYFEKDGVRYHHILDPETGYPAESGLVSVTVISDSGVLSDALSTACFVLGEEKGMELCKEFGCEAVFLNKNNRVNVTAGIADKIKVTNENYSFDDYSLR